MTLWLAKNFLTIFFFFLSTCSSCKMLQELTSKKLFLENASLKWFFEVFFLIVIIFIFLKKISVCLPNIYFFLLSEIPFHI
jgi:hypothetical protein